MKSIIKISNLNRNFNEVKALQNINLEVKKGEWIAIMGPSGSGKSTLLNILSLMDTQSSGEYFLDDKEVGNLSEEEKSVIRREKIGLIFQQFHLIPYLNALENVMLAQFYHSSIEQKDAIMAIEKVGLSHRLTHLPSQLSGGEQQRLCIARALVNDPEILLADEPTGNLDEANEKNILELFCKLKQDGKTIVLITHNPDLATFADRTIILSHGVMKSEN
ncbi:ABC transporter ATP-binding protein [Campylobacter lari]|uniref:Ferrirhodotorulic acid ABC transporter, ATP-binding protein n=1 Tax=Campylobacter lari NCTC 11845 TaxID=1388749 RepID=A0A0A8HWX1_CAMLA|nr:ABC transporter ATP-binding protein [Campylobacter lari]AJD02218.1 ferrirhodotorulic acid ABC transporter, ATP-binding protein [Campylobacter lari NCTC 11845]EAK0848235.1 ABC transporter ATP-binding protein [Campylobacter lari]EAK0979755.1 ABC transporter ATP-binding protein [Campylobacter lari]EAK9954093.1 ABC transporter ATP-binding protein [Campylobacter lari]MCR6543524.1 ABC transporter ATP-binding protein [Campylobacter lari]